MNNLTIKNNEKSFMFVKCSNSTYLIDTENIIEIIKIPRMEYPQRLPRYISGVFDYRGRILNTADLRNILGFEIKPYDKDTNIVILEEKNDGKVLALAVEYIEKIEKVDISFIKPATINNSFSFTRGIYVKDEETSVVLDIHKIIRQVFEGIQNGEMSDMPNILPNNDIEVYNKRALEYKNKIDWLQTSEFNDDNTYITFNANNINYCIHSKFTKGFFKLNQEKITPIPSSKNFIKGILNIRGEYISIIDINAFFGREETEVSHKSTIIIPDAKDFKIGILADSVGESVNIENALETQEDETNCVLGEKVYNILNIKNILNNEKLYLK